MGASRSFKELGRGAAVVALLMMGCASTQSLARPAKTFQESYDEAAPALAELYTGLNRWNRRSQWIASSCADVAPSAAPPSAATTPPPGYISYEQVFAVPFSRDAIQVRLDTIELLGRYAQRLSELAGTAAPAEFSESAGALGERLGGLETRARTLAGDSAFTAISGPLGAVVGALGQAYLERRTRAQVRDALIEAEPAVIRVLEFLENDLQRTVDRVRRLQTDSIATSCVVYYNNHYAAWSVAERRAFLREVEGVIELQEAYESSNPARLVRAMRDAHETLVRFARDPGAGPTQATRLARDIDAFSARVAAFGRAFRALRHLESTVDGLRLEPEATSRPERDAHHDAPASTPTPARTPAAR